MPPKYKLMVSLLVVIVAAAVFHFQREAGQAVTPWVALGLGAFMIFGIWLFPEARKEK